jgi:hypothetical protein
MAEEVAYVVVGVVAAVGFFTAVSTTTIDHPVIPTNDVGDDSSYTPEPDSGRQGDNQQASSNNKAQNQIKADQDQIKLILPAVYNKPASLTFEEETEVSLVIQTAPDQTLSAETMGLKGELTHVQLHLNDKVSAALSGNDVEVKLRGDGGSREITDFGPVQWIWDVKPTKAGNTILTLEVFALLDNGNETVKVRTFRDKIPVVATLPQRIKASVAFLDPIWTFLAAVVGGLGGFIIWFWQRLLPKPAPATKKTRDKPKPTKTLTVEQTTQLNETVRKTFSEFLKRHNTS